MTSGRLRAGGTAPRLTTAPEDGGGGGGGGGGLQKEETSPKWLEELQKKYSETKKVPV